MTLSKSEKLILLESLYFFQDEGMSKHTLSKKEITLTNNLILKLERNRLDCCSNITHNEKHGEIK